MMVKKIKLEQLKERLSATRLLVAMFYTKGCQVCNEQEDEMHSIQKPLKGKVEFYKLNAMDKTIDGVFDIKTVPCIIMWANGQQARFWWSETVSSSQIVGLTSGKDLLKAISWILNNYSD